MDTTPAADIILTPSAASRVAAIAAKQGKPAVLRLSVEGGGCSGFSYGFTLDEEQNEDDFTVEQSGITILVDSMSMQYLQGAKIDYKEEFMGSQFVITNPNAQSTCGCGSSFSV